MEMPPSATRRREWSSQETRLAACRSALPLFSHPTLLLFLSLSLRSFVPLSQPVMPPWRRCSSLRSSHLEPFARYLYMHECLIETYLAALTYLWVYYTYTCTGCTPSSEQRSYLSFLVKTFFGHTCLVKSDFIYIRRLDIDFRYVRASWCGLKHICKTWVEHRPVKSLKPSRIKNIFKFYIFYYQQ